MDVMALGAIGELVGGVAVLATLVYLALQIRQNTRVAHSSVRLSIATNTTAGAGTLAYNGALSELVHRSVVGETLRGGEAIRLQAFIYQTFRQWENIHWQHGHGMLSDEEWSSYRTNLKLLLQVPGWRDYWSREGSIYTASFRVTIDSLLDEIQRGDRVSPESVLAPNRPEPQA